MNYENFCKSRDAAWQIIVDLKISSLPVKIVKVCRALGIQVKLYESTDKNDGYCKMYPNEPIIFVNSFCGRQRQRFTVAHELGHIILGHVGKYTLVNREPSPQDSPIEAEANVFASRLLAPACVLHEIGVRTPADISNLCDISLQSAKFRYERIRLLEERNLEYLQKYNHGCFYQNPLEYEVYLQFKDFIKTQRL